MSIDEAIEFGEKHYHTSLSSLETREERVEHIRKLGDYEHLAIETIRKYQKIAEIADEWKHDHDNLNYADDSYYWSKVREVLEDGNDD